jgi:hypothetical protein
LARGKSETSQVLAAWSRAVAAAPRQVRDLQGGSEAADVVVLVGDVEEPAASPRGSDLLTSFLPVDRASLESAIDRFLVEFEKLGTEWGDEVSATRLVPALAAVTIPALALEVVRRKRIAKDSAGLSTEADEEGLVRFPGYPTHWSLGEV